MVSIPSLDYPKLMRTIRPLPLNSLESTIDKTDSRIIEAIRDLAYIHGEEPWCDDPNYDFNNVRLPIDVDILGRAGRGISEAEFQSQQRFKEIDARSWQQRMDDENFWADVNTALPLRLYTPRGFYWLHVRSGRRIHTGYIDDFHQALDVEKLTPTDKIRSPSPYCIETFHRAFHVDKMLADLQQQISNPTIHDYYRGVVGTSHRVRINPDLDLIERDIVQACLEMLEEKREKYKAA